MLMSIKELTSVGFEFYNIYGTRSTAESVADALRDKGYDTAIRM